MSKFNKILLFISLVIVMVIVIVIVAYAWTNPSGNPPSGGGALYYSGGNVGIGTTSPGYKLDVSGDINFSGKLREDGAEIFSGIIALFDTSCPTGWTRFTALDGRVAMGSASYGTTGGADTHTHTGPSHTHTGPSHTHDMAHAHVKDYGGDYGGGGLQYYGPTVANTGAGGTGATGAAGTGATGAGSSWAPYITMVFCKKNVGADLAEWTSSQEKYDPGTIVVLDPEANERIKIAERPYDSTLAGVISSQPGWTIGSETADSLALALAGRVSVKVSLLNGPIKIGDPITSSLIPGVGMKADQPGQIIGRAMANFNELNASKSCSDPVSGENFKCGEVMVFINLGYYAGELAADTLVTNATYRALTIDSAGNVGIGTTSPNARFQISGGDAAVTTQGNGVILRATDGANCYRVTVNNAGTLNTASVTCP